MHGRTRQLAYLLLALSNSLLLQFPAQAQYLPYGTSRYPKVLSATEDSSGNFLLLNLQNKVLLPAPSIQYYSSGSGQTMMVADFQGVIWSAEPKVIRPANPEITSVRLGQFQENPPIFRISISVSNSECLKYLEFRCQSKALVIKYPAIRTAVAAAAVAMPLTSSTSAMSVTSASSIAPLKRSEANLPPVAVATEKISKRNSSSRSQRMSTLKTMTPITDRQYEALQTNNPPFRHGGLYLELGPDPAVPTDSSNSSMSSAALLTERKMASGKSKRTEKLPPVAPDLNARHQNNDMPETAPEIAKAEEDGADGNKKRHGLASHLHHLFHKQSTEEIAAEAAAAEAAKGAAEGGRRSADATKTPDADMRSAALSLAQANANPQVDISGANPIKVRLKFDTTPKYKCFKVDDPPRFVIDVENQQARLNQLPTPEKNLWLKSVRVGAPDEKTTRIVLDLAQAHVLIKDELDEQKQSLMLTLSSGGLAEETSTKRREVVLDAGHGGSDPGAQRGDVSEKDITLAITQKLKRYLEDRGIKVVMTRRDDTFVSLEDRTKITNEMHPDAFVSIHINSLETDRDIQGIETYYQTDQSRALADKVHAQLVEMLQVPDRSVRKARFYVVKNTDRPAILAEVGFISNKTERDKLISSDYQAKIAESVGQGVMLYLGKSTEPTYASLSAATSPGNIKLAEGKKVKSAMASNGKIR